MPRKKPAIDASPEGEGFVLKLTAKQHECLLKFAELTGSLKVKFDAKESLRFVLTQAELDDLDDELDVAVDRARANDKQKVEGIVVKGARLLMAENATSPALTSKKTVYQFKIRLLNTYPAIWRRVEIRDGTLEDLHDVIQLAFGWDGEHLHEFHLDGRGFNSDGVEENDDDERDVRLSELVPTYGPKSKWIYEYDFGDSWRHYIQFEGFPANDPKRHYPCCVDGKRACPPEDCGGPLGYAELLETLADPNDLEHDDMKDAFENLDPEAFDVKAINKKLRRLR